VVDRRLASMLVVLGAVLAADGAIAASKGAVEVAGPGLVVGLALLATGVALVLRRRVLFAGIALCFLAALAMADRLHRTARLVPALPLGILAVALGYALLAERRRIVRERAGKPPPR